MAALAASLVAALAAASPVLAPDGCTGVSAALAAHHCASLRDLFTRAAIVNCSSDPCGCWCSRDDDADQLCRANRRSCALCENLCALPPRAADARGEALRRLEFSYAFSANPIDRSGHHEHHEKHWWEPYYAHYKMDPVTPRQYLILLGACGGVASIIALIVCALPKDSLMYRSWFVQL